MKGNYMIQIYDTMTKSLRPFEPLILNKVSMYICGPTVYNYIHLGNARSIIAFDTVRRYFEYRGYDVNFVSNFTDIDDKIIAKANDENQSIKQITDKYIEAFYQDCQALNIKPAQNPKVTEFIPQIIQFIQDLLDKDVAYVTNDGVYFSVDKDPQYGELSHKCLDELKTGASERLSENLEKKNALDFVLWKFVKKSEPYWTSPWGNGRPGWHIKPVISLDKYYKGDIQLNISRYFELFGFQKQAKDLICSTEYDEEIPLKPLICKLPVDEYILVDDDSVSGYTVKRLSQEIDTIVDIHTLMEQVYDDVVDARDFLFGAKYSGLLCKLPNGNVKRFPYIWPYVNLYHRATINLNQQALFSQLIKEANQEFQRNITIS